MEGAANVGSEMSRVHIAEKNKQMADMLKVQEYVPHTLVVFYLSYSQNFCFNTCLQCSGPCFKWLSCTVSFRHSPQS